MAEGGSGRWARGIDDPRRLPEGLRARLEEAILAEAESGPAEDLDPTHADPVAASLVGIDGPRPLPVDLRRRLERRLATRRRPPVWLAGAAAAVLAAAAIGAAIHGTGGSAPPGLAAGPPQAGSAAGAAGGSATAVSPGGGLASAAPGGTRTRGLLSPATPVAGAGADSAGGAAGPGGGAAVAAPAAAVIREVNPTAGPLAGGTEVTISGQGLSRTTGVSFGSVPARSFAVRSDGTVTALSPAAQRPGAVAVSVLTANGPAPVAQGGSNAFDYVAPPSVSGISPPLGPAAGGNWVTVTGAGFAAGDTVSFGDAAAARVVVDSAGQLQALAPAHPPGQVDVVVTGPGGDSTSGPADRYTFT